ncbi:MAG: hypothetical protein ABI583_03425, partial [Betaproteobacteria bacterium]
HREDMPRQAGSFLSCQTLGIHDASRYVGHPSTAGDTVFRTCVQILSALICAGSLAFNAAAGTEYGELARNAVSVAELTEVQAEICRDHLLDPSGVKVRLPAGYRLAMASEIAGKDQKLASLIARDARYSSYAIGSLCFMSTGSFVVDGARAHSPGLTPMAFWWVRVMPSKDTKTDPRMKGRLDWLQLASWYSHEGTDRARIIAADPMAQFVDLVVNRVQKDNWRVRMALASGVIDVDVRVSGPHIKRNAPQPGFMTVLFSGDSADYFTVFTYFGHQHRNAEGIWQANGSGVFADAFKIPGEAETFDTFFQDGWQARSGLYRLEGKDAQQGTPAGASRR